LNAASALAVFTKDVGFLSIEETANDDVTVAVKLSDLLVGKDFSLAWHCLRR